MRRFGGRRRQCVQCKGTWRIRKKKRGRKRIRASATLAVRYLSRDIATLRSFAKRFRVGKDHAQLLLRRSMESYAVRTEEWTCTLPAAVPLILVADAIWYRIQGIKYTIYVLLLRPVEGREAVIAPPVVSAGHEDIAGWEQAYASLPELIRSRICALVCDGGTGLVALAHRKGLHLQRCHFHLFAAVQNYLTTGPRSLHRAYAVRILRSVQHAVRAPEHEARITLRALGAVRRCSRSRGVRRVLGGLALHWQEYRTYLAHPELHLPATSNAAESYIQGIRDLMYRCRGFRTVPALKRWLTAFVCFKKTIQCNETSTELTH